MRLYLPIGEGSWGQSLNTAKLAKNTLGLYVFASPWSMPAEWKTINSVNAKVNGNQNYLKEQYYGTYADYLNNYVAYLKNNGVNLDAISIQNEPDWPCEYAGCIFNTQQIVNFLANYCGRINCKVIAPETIGMLGNYANALLNSSSALNNFDIYSGHQYAGVGSAFKNIANKGKGGNKNGVRSRTHQPSGKSFTKYSLPTVMNKDAQNAKKAADRLKTLNQRRQPIPPLHKSTQNFNNHRPSIDSVMH